MFNKLRDYFMNDWLIHAQSTQSIKDTLVTDRGGQGLIVVNIHSWPFL